MKQIVGTIQGYNVVYIPEKQVVFCKNTVCHLKDLESIVLGDLQRGEIPEKNLSITKDNGIVSFGCLTTTYDNCLKIRKNCKKYGRQNSW